MSMEIDMQTGNVMYNISEAFSQLCIRLSPNEFVTAFKFEYPQTIAYILSFANSSNYCKKVFKLLPEEYKDIIASYLSKVSDEKINNEIFSVVEKYITNMLEQYTDSSNIFRKNITLPISKEGQINTQVAELVKDGNNG